MQDRPRCIAAAPVAILCAASFLGATQLSAADRATIVAAVRAQVHPKPVIVDRVVAEHGYAIANWSAAGGYYAGQALVRRSYGRWVVVTSGGGCVTNVPYLQRLGVPSSTANALKRDLGKASC